MMEALSDANLKQNYQSHLKRLKLKGLQPEIIEAIHAPSAESANSLIIK